MSEETLPNPDPAKIRKIGYLTKLGGGDGGRKNWKKRYFVLEDNLYYYDDEKDYKSNGKPKWIKLDAYYASKATDNEPLFEFNIHAYPKSMCCRADSMDEMQGWLDALLQPLQEYINLTES